MNNPRKKLPKEKAITHNDFCNSSSLHGCIDGACKICKAAFEAGRNSIKVNRVMKVIIPGFKRRAELAMKDPIKELAIELHKEGYTEQEIFENTKDKYPDAFSVKLRNCVRDLERMGVISKPLIE